MDSLPSLGPLGLNAGPMGGGGGGPNPNVGGAMNQPNLYQPNLGSLSNPAGSPAKSYTPLGGVPHVGGGGGQNMVGQMQQNQAYGIQALTSQLQGKLRRGAL